MDVSEDNGKRTTRSTGMFAGTELHLTSLLPHFDIRLPERPDRPEFNYNVKLNPIDTDQDWQDVSRRRGWAGHGQCVDAGLCARGWTCDAAQYAPSLSALHPARNPCSGTTNQKSVYK